MTKTKTKTWKIPKKEKFFRLPILNRFLLCLIVICGVFYMALANDISIKGFVLSDFNIQLKEEQKKQEELKILSLNMQSMENIEERAKNLKMVKVDTIEYIDANDLGVALK
ncbi:MAG: hypothetical protein U9Q85_01710 [Patescibacteria group bacterium]|nr:hypothetical protein [Patescibacteria group bacterium]